ncbi:ACR262Cp [Eremothecium gossypii ATCC 10895]|uniref:Altered inheritance of mitochondria protein 23, mitochondrial n=1 Tax=Eremothecium gossypii (strain ATCC 10895 / CBS 109.51 / FGSC 9923 / NRRL Y-1056) TaxID=284811 RepID=AIM23_EREGS|nr:ACR262Cp [Eremothecium gossypii ATCC 10895]Q75BK9.1 RecName: Full=Altered inheritance of mitochondria protein 23, mitochondrial; Flags: Precursor [Eremothecium gossypii ATCC 10895]AAS51488.1 ACR262Cp [Eremothecium gossypii ATCC 10895]
MFRRIVAVPSSWSSLQLFSTSAVRSSNGLAAILEQVSAKKSAPREAKTPSKYADRKPQHSSPVRKKKVFVRWTTGSEKAREIANTVVSEVLSIRSDGRLRLILPEENRIQELSMQDVARQLDLEVHSLRFIKSETDAGGRPLPLVKRVSVREAFRVHAERMAAEREKELLRKGVSARRVGAKERRAPDSKQVRISWQISPTDFSNQKSKEIRGHLERGHTVLVLLANKDASGPAPQVSPRELQRRSSLLDELAAILEDINCSVVRSGDPASRVELKLVPKAPQEVDRHALKEQRRLQRAEKLKRRLERRGPASAQE